MIDLSVPAGERGWNVEVIFDVGGCDGNPSTDPGGVRGVAQVAKDHGLVNIIRVDYHAGVAVPFNQSDYEWWSTNFINCVNELSDLASLFIVGNEPNIEGNISAAQYASAFNYLYSRKGEMPAGTQILSTFNSPFTLPDWMAQMSWNLGGVDGFALHTGGVRPNCQDPRQPCSFGGWPFDGAFRYYRDVINNIDTRWWSRPVYITEFNTYTGDPGSEPDKNYPTNWINQAFEEIRSYNATRGTKPQVKAVAWFVDRPQSWPNFALRNIPAARSDMAEEFKNPANRVGGTIPPTCPNSPLPTPNDRWKLEIWNDRFFSGAPVEQRHDAPGTGDFTFDWIEGGPSRCAGADNFAVRFSRSAYFALSGIYTFTATADDGVRVWVDGVSIIDAWWDQGATSYIGQRDLSAGWHDLRMDYYENGGWAYAALNWAFSGGGANNADVLDAESSIPARMSPGETKAVTIRVKNTGTTTWRTADAYRLGSEGENNFSWSGFRCGGYMIEPNNARVFLCNDVSPGATYDFNFDITAPSTTSNSAVLSVGMVQDGKEWFGEAFSWLIPIDSCTASVPSSNWKGEYFSNRYLVGTPVMVRDDSNGFLNFDWGTGSPGTACGIGADNFSARWTRTVNFAAGTYRFTITSDDGFRLYLDGALVRFRDAQGNEVETWKDQAPTTYMVDVPVSAGSHTVKFEYYENGGLAVAKLSWQGLSRSPPEFGAASSAAAETAELIWPHPVAGTDRLLLVGASIRGNVPIASVTYAGLSLTKIRHDTLGTDVRSELWYLVGPPIGTHDVNLRLSSAQNIIAGATSWTNVDQASPLGNHAGANHGESAGTTATVQVASAADQVVVDVVATQAAGATVTAGPLQTVHWNRQGNHGNGAGSSEPGAATTTLSWTLAYPEFWTISAVALKPTGGGVGSDQWPNAQSAANSDPWLAEHHHEIRLMRPRVLALNFVNQKSMEQMRTHLEQLIDAIAQASRYHGYSNTSAPAFLQYELPPTQAIDLRDPQPAPNGNSSRYPRENPVEGAWGFDYERLFTAEFTQYYNIADPNDPGRLLSLCELIDRGIVHEVWIYGDGDTPDVGAAEILELKPRYDENRRRIPGAMNRCAGNGCFDDEDNIPCIRTVRIGWVNHSRGVGCFLESFSHGLESTGRDHNEIPYLARYFVNFAGFDLNTRYGLPFDSWYACPPNDETGPKCLTYPSETSLYWSIPGYGSGQVLNYDPVCGNVHFPPNARGHYDLSSPYSVRTSCAHYRDGSGRTEEFTTQAFAAYGSVAPDCDGPFLVWWGQNIPGLDNASRDTAGNPMLNWWPFLFY